jgi:hypothetical protein
VIYQVNAKLILDTRTNKVIIESHDKRLVFFPGKKIAEHWVDVTLDDRPQGGSFSYAKDMCKFIVQNLHARPERKKILKEVTGDG